MLSLKSCDQSQLTLIQRDFTFCTQRNEHTHTHTDCILCTRSPLKAGVLTTLEIAQKCYTDSLKFGIIKKKLMFVKEVSYAQSI